MKSFQCLVAVCALVCGCATAPSIQAPASPPPELSALVERLQTRALAVSSLSADGSVTYFGPDGRIRLRTVIAVRRADHFRIETLTPFEQPVDVMSSDGARLWLLADGRLAEGPATPENIARLLPIRLGPNDLVDALLGGVPTGTRFEPKSVQSTEGGLRLLMEGPGGERAELGLEGPESLVRSVAVYRPNGTLRLSATFSRFKGQPAFATLIQLELPERDGEVTIRLKDFTLNADLEDRLFAIQAPNGIPPEPLDSPPARLAP